MPSSSNSRVILAKQFLETLNNHQTKPVEIPQYVAQPHQQFFGLDQTQSIRRPTQALGATTQLTRQASASNVNDLSRLKEKLQMISNQQQNAELVQGKHLQSFDYTQRGPLRAQKDPIFEQIEQDTLRIQNQLMRMPLQDRTNLPEYP